MLRAHTDVSDDTKSVSSWNSACKFSWDKFSNLSFQMLLVFEFYAIAHFFQGLSMAICSSIKASIKVWTFSPFVEILCAYIFFSLEFCFATHKNIYFTINIHTNSLNLWIKWVLEWFAFEIYALKSQIHLTKMRRIVEMKYSMHRCYLKLKSKLFGVHESGHHGQQ